MAGAIVCVSIVTCMQTFRSDLHRFHSHHVQSNASSQIRPRAHNERATQCRNDSTLLELRAAERTHQTRHSNPADRPGTSFLLADNRGKRGFGGRVELVNDGRADLRPIWLHDLRAGGDRRVWARRRRAEGHRIAPAVGCFRVFSTASLRNVARAKKKNPYLRDQNSPFPASPGGAGAMRAGRLFGWASLGKSPGPVIRPPPEAGKKRGILDLAEEQNAARSVAVAADCGS